MQHRNFSFGPFPPVFALNVIFIKRHQVIFVIYANAHDHCPESMCKLIVLHLCNQCKITGGQLLMIMRSTVFNNVLPELIL